MKMIEDIITGLSQVLSLGKKPDKIPAPSKPVTVSVVPSPIAMNAAELKETIPVNILNNAGLRYGEINISGGYASGEITPVVDIREGYCYMENMRPYEARGGWAPFYVPVLNKQEAGTIYGMDFVYEFLYDGGGPVE